MTITAQHIPGPSPHRWLGRRGNAHAYASDPVGYTARLYHRHGPVSGLVRGDLRQVFAFGAESNRAVLTQGDEFHTVLEYLIPERIRRARRGIGLLNMNGPPHREARRTVMPSFRPRVIEGHAELIARLATEEVDGWTPGVPIDLTASMRRLTLRIACLSFFGVDIARQAESIGGLVRDMLSLRYFATSIRYFPFDLPGTPYRRLLRVIGRLDGALAGIVESRRGGGESSDLLQSLLEARDDDGRGLSDDQLIGHLTTLLVAGHETSSSTLAWALILLSQHRDELGRVVEALPEAYPGEPLDPGELTGTTGIGTALGDVVKETLRLLPPGPNTSRITTTATEVGGYEVPAGSHVVTSKFVTHRDPVVFPEPLRFRPGRWEAAAPTRYEYLPYGAGPHVCVGAAFADMEMRIVLGTILSRYALRPVAGTDVSREVGLMMSPRGAVPMVPHPRSRTAAPEAAREPIGGDVNQMVDMYGDDRWRLGW